MKQLEKLNLGILPTPIHRLKGLEELLPESKRMYIKRDDMTGVGFGGNKVRKLEYILKYALDNGYDTVLTTGGPQSNHAMLTVACARKVGLDVELFLEGNAPDVTKGNLLLEEIMGVKANFVSDRDGKSVEAAMQERIDELAEKGKKALLIPVGGSMKEGISGYVDAVYEIKNQLEEMQVSIDHIVCTVGSGGTYAGILLGTRLAGLDIPVTGIAIAPEEFEKEIWRLIEETCDYAGVKNPVSQCDIIVKDFSGEGYAIPSAEGNAAVREVACREGIFVDPVYTGKSIGALLHLAEDGYFDGDDDILFMHTGGGVALFAIPLED